MSQDSRSIRTPASFYTQVDISAAGQAAHSLPHPLGPQHEQVELLREILTAQDRTNELLEELVTATTAQQKQRVNELNQWKQAHPELARSCRKAAEGLSQVQVQFLDRMTEEIQDTVEDLADGDFMLSEFVDRYGPRMAHLNGVIQVLAQLSSVPNPTDAPQ